MDAVTTLNPQDFSTSVISAAARLGNEGPVPAAAVARAISELHPEYAGGHVTAFQWPENGKRLPAEEWVSLARTTLIDRGMLEGRLLVAALGLLEPPTSWPEEAAEALRFEIRARRKDEQFSTWKAVAASVKLDRFTPLARAAVNRTMQMGHFAAASDSLGLLQVLLAQSEVAKGTDAAGRLLSRMPKSLAASLGQVPPVSRDPDDDTPLTRELLIVLEQAALMSGSEVRPRHLVVALLGHLSPRPCAQWALDAWGVDLGDVRRTVLEYLRLNRDSNTLDSARRLFADGAESDEQAIPAKASIRLAGYDADIVTGVRDRLGVERDVAALSALLAAQRTKPPLSIGLFGDWGSGKSFFLERMRRRVETLEGKPDFCRRVVQVEFNAWHYLDANLWASLVTHIFDRLFEEICEPDKIGDKLKDAEGLFSAAQADHIRAQNDVAAAETGLTDAQRDRESKETSLKSVVDDLKGLFADEPQMKAALVTAADRVGISPAISSYEELTRNVAEIRTLAGRVTAIGHSILSDPVRNLLLLGVVLLLPIAVDALIELSSQQFWKDLRWIANTTSVLAALVGWLSTQVKAGNSWIRNVEEAYEKVAAARQTRIVDSEKQERAELQLAREREAAAKRRLEEATLQLQRIEQEIEAQKPGPRLRRFIEERGGNSDYTKHLSIITLIRKDFEALSDLIGTGDPALPIDRIVLYIDDLDRCRPARVIEVLEAVHLLLAFRLFVVVVAVDPRWLTRCLELHYPELLGGRGLEEMDASSPQDYLEKIFQIPFMVRPIDVRGYCDLIRSLVPISAVQPSPPKTATRTEPADRTEAPSVASTPVTPTESVPVDFSSPSALSPPHISTPAENLPQRERPAAGIQDEESFKVDPSQLEITAAERLGIEALAPLFTTPRSVKRFVNIYRLMRVSLGPDELGVFEGTDDAPGDHRTALLLLALVTNYPRLATHVLARLNTTSDIRTWPQFLSHVASPEAPVPQGLVNDDAADWKRMCGRLRLLESEHLPDVLASSVTWTPRVVRYSFFVAPRIA